MKKYRIILSMIIGLFVIYSCNNSLDLDYQNNIIIGKKLATPDSTLIGDVSTSFLQGLTLYFRITTKEEIKNDYVTLHIIKTSDGKNATAFIAKRWFQEPDFHACTFAVSKLDTGAYKAILTKGTDPTSLATRNLVIYLNE